MSEPEHSQRSGLHAVAEPGGSVNDKFVAAVLGGFRRYHEHFCVPVDTIPAAMPISLRTVTDAAGGNRA